MCHISEGYTYGQFSHTDSHSVLLLIALKIILSFHLNRFPLQEPATPEEKKLTPAKWDVGGHMGHLESLV